MHTDWFPEHGLSFLNIADDKTCQKPTFELLAGVSCIDDEVNYEGDLNSVGDLEVT